MYTDSQNTISAIKNSKSPIICMDSRVDFDCVCSTLIMRDYINRVSGIDPTVTLETKLPNSLTSIIKDYYDLSFIKQDTCPTTSVDFAKHDLQIFLDSGTRSHVCEEGKFTEDQGCKISVNIDHHRGNLLYGTYNFVRHMGSCTSVLYTLFKETGESINPKMGNAYYLGLVLDTGYFQYNTLTSTDLRNAADLYDMGIQSDELLWKLTFNVSLDDLKLQGLAYKNLVVDNVSNFAYTVIRKQELKENHINYEETTISPSDSIKRLQGVDFVVAIREEEDRKWHMSFRSHATECDVLKLAKQFNGGGHVRAAAGRYEAKTPEEVLEKIRSTLANN